MSRMFHDRDETGPNGGEPDHDDVPAASPSVRVGRIAWVFLRLGATTYGGMWGATRTLEKDLVDRARWLRKHELQRLLVVSTLIPAPKFMSFGGLVGFSIGRWLGSFTAVSALVFPGSILVATAAAMISPDALRTALAPLSTSVAVAIVGLLVGNAYHQIRSSKVSGRNRVIGLALAAVIFVSIVLGVPLILAALVGLIVGTALIRQDTSPPPVEVES